MTNPHENADNLVVDLNPFESVMEEFNASHFNSLAIFETLSKGGRGWNHYN